MLGRVFGLLVWCGVCLANYDGHTVVRVLHPPEEQPSLVKKWSNTYPASNNRVPLDIFGMSPGGVVVRVPPEIQTAFFNDLKENGIKHTIIEENLQTLLDHLTLKNEEARAKGSSSYNFTYYMTIDEIYAWQDELAVACSYCEVENIGLSFEERPVRVFKIEPSGSNSGKRKIWIDAGIHAREWIAYSTGMYILEQIAENIDPAVANILNTYDVYVLSAVNPDGYAYTWTDEGRMWRKTRSTQDGVNCTGVDANRNFDFMWMTIGASSDPCEDTYAGPQPFSESEAMAMADFIMADNAYDVFLTLHTYSQLWMSPFGYTLTLPEDYDELMRVANAGADALTAVYGTNYTVGAASQILYESSGTSRDWARGGLDQDEKKGAGITYVYTLELRNESSFLLPPEEILPTGIETWEGFKAMMSAIMNP